MARLSDRVVCGPVNTRRAQREADSMQEHANIGIKNGMKFDRFHKDKC